MRRTVNGTALAAVLALALTGCGSDSSKEDGTAAKETASTASPTETAGDESRPDDSGNGADGAETTREVTLELSGEGTPTGAVFYMLNTMKTEPVTELPWTLTETLPLRGAEVKVGRAVTVTPPSVQDASGKLVPAKCVIKVDGKVVADNTDEDNGFSGCRASVK